MPRIFNIEVFNDVCTGTDDYRNNPELNEILARADRLNFQFTITQVGGTSPTLTAKLQISNDNRHYDDHTTLLNAVDISNPPYRASVDSDITLIGAFARISLTLGGTTPAAHVRVNTCGRTMG